MDKVEREYKEIMTEVRGGAPFESTKHQAFQPLFEMRPVPASSPTVSSPYATDWTVWKAAHLGGDGAQRVRHPGYDFHNHLQFHFLVLMFSFANRVHLEFGVPPCFLVELGTALMKASTSVSVLMLHPSTAWLRLSLAKSTSPG